MSEALGFVSNLALVREAKSYPTRERSARNCPPPPCGGGRRIPSASLTGWVGFRLPDGLTREGGEIRRSALLPSPLRGVEVAYYAKA